MIKILFAIITLLNQTAAYEEEVMTSSISKEPIEEVQHQEVIFSNFYDNQFALSGLSKKDMTVENGMYRYEGCIAIATAHDTLGSVREGYTTYKLKDKVKLKINGQDDCGIVIDKCGACHGVPHEKLQRIDILSTKAVRKLERGVISNEQ